MQNEALIASMLESECFAELEVAINHQRSYNPEGVLRLGMWPKSLCEYGRQSRSDTTAGDIVLDGIEQYSHLTKSDLLKLSFGMFHPRKYPQLRTFLHQGSPGSSSSRLFSFAGIPGVELGCRLKFI